MIVNNVFNKFLEINNQLQKIEQEVEGNLTNPALLQQRLDEVFSKIEGAHTYCSLSDNAQTTLEEMKERTIELYGKLHDQEFFWELCLLQTQAKKVEASLDTPSASQHIEELKVLLEEFEKGYLPALNERKQLNELKKFIVSCEEFILGRGQKPALPIIDEKVEAFSSEEVDEMMEFFEVAELFYKQKEGEAKRLLNQLLPLIPQKLANRLSQTIGNEQKAALLVDAAFATIGQSAPKEPLDHLLLSGQFSDEGQIYALHAS